ncbi:MAG: NAD(P)-dependent glycerol-3-phosphate dehydrogenase [Acidobacteriaceae bacterium]|nr:NAD(P)-dependent glycerol-3-phosphate dehydrogenase [Acidobacteriaceae bacterium]MBV9767250.1 NAD(P)-dependent glycerol-3-phosphate dehydrogenase [Acidobacteriaceae bacterium]
MSRLAVLGAGSWGTALSSALAQRFDTIRLWARNAERASEIARLRENRRYLPGFILPECVAVSADLAFTLEDAEVLLSVVPSRHLRCVLRAAAPHVPPRTKIVSATKGIEEDTLCRMSEIVMQTLGGASRGRIAVLSGPTFAAEIAAGEPAAVVIASEDLSFAEEMQRALATPALRFYASTDVIGVELGAALKNVIAIGAGICRGLGLGSNSIAALVTRGLAEITRLAVTMGGNPRTLSGLAGLGDLVLTATGDLSRNRFVGIELGRGVKLDEILAGMNMVAEGVGTCRAAYQLGAMKNVDLPIINKMHQVLYESKDPRLAIRELMERPLTSE